MSRFDALVAGVLGHTRLAILAMVLLSVAVGAGAPMVEQSSSLDQFQTDSVEAQKLEYIQENFTRGEEDTTTAQIIVRGENVLSKRSLLATLAYEQRLTESGAIEPTLAADEPVVGVANVVAIAAIRREAGTELAADVKRLQAARTAFERNRSALQNRSDQLNATTADLQAALDVIRRNPDADVDEQWAQVRTNTSVELDAEDRRTFEQAAAAVRQASTRAEYKDAYRLGTRGVLEDQYRDLGARSAALEEEGERLQALAEEVEAGQAALENATNASLQEQVAQLESMNESEVDATLALVLNASANTGALSLMPTDYEPGATAADATMLVVTQRTEQASTAGAAASGEIVDSQLAMQDLDRPGGLTYAVFGAGVITEEIDASMADSMTIVAPLALLFVLLALVVGYRDPLDILLGLVGIGLVLAWTFGFMGWAGIAFNQIFIAVPVLLIGLSIDYAIHIFMRHREERLGNGHVGDEEGVAGPRPSMTVALGGVGIALVWVTATTVIGFLSNLTSPVAPIREFGVVSSFGIVAALLVFGVLVPALKVELDEALEARSVDRRKRAIGTGGGALSSVLAVGATAARRAPAAVILLALVVTAAGAYGGSQVDTSFEEEDFLAERPPAWMHDLPEPFAPGEYTAKENLQLVDGRFIREDSQAQILVEGDVTRPGTLERVAEAQAAAADKPAVQTIASGEPDIRSPLTVMADVARENESFNATFSAADTDGDGVPDSNLAGVYDALYAAAPDRAVSVVHRTDGGEYAALRMVVSVRGSASGDAVTRQMRSVAAGLDGGGLQATATGGSILNNLVQEELLETVIQSLLVTVAAVFVFLMAAYRLTEGSATLGLVTLLPVVLSVAWILGTMWLLSIPFNVLTGMITSLTVGLGVAYSIHLSERYNQELDRRGSVWEAMRTAVTGTGGALLGSAATTVGGFGVLVFAILPPLQQFGLITGLTIIYAFLASVLVLPSLLVVWTRFFGPGGTRQEVRDAGSPFGGLVGGGSADGAGDAGGSGKADPPDADPGPPGGAAARRSVDFDLVTPGGTVAVEVRVRGVDGRLVLVESFDGAVEDVIRVEPDPVDVVRRDGTIYVALEADGEATVAYRARVPPAAGEGDEPLFTGRIVTAGGAGTVGGVQRITVVEDIFERVLARGAVVEDDLGAAGQQLAGGELTPEQYERILAAWLRDGSLERPAGGEGRDGGDGRVAGEGPEASGGRERGADPRDRRG